MSTSSHYSLNRQQITTTLFDSEYISAFTKKNVQPTSAYFENFKSAVYHFDIYHISILHIRFWKQKKTRKKQHNYGFRTDQRKSMLCRPGG